MNYLDILFPVFICLMIAIVVIGFASYMIIEAIKEIQEIKEKEMKLQEEKERLERKRKY